MDKLKGWKSVLFNTLVAAVGGLQLLGMDLPGDFADDLNGAILAVVGVIGVFLRAVTDTPVGWKR